MGDNELKDMRLTNEVLEYIPLYGYRRISKQLTKAHSNLTPISHQDLDTKQASHVKIFT